MLKEFKEFAMRGSVIDLAVGVVIGAAFGKIVTSLVDDIIMPPIGRLVGHVDFSNLFVTLSEAHYDTLADAKKAGAATLNYGIFLNNVVNFLIVAFAIFYRGAAGESLDEEACATGGSHYQGLSAMHHGDSLSRQSAARNAPRS